MKVCLVICDGMADRRCPPSYMHTPLEVARTPAMDALASQGVAGLVRTVPDGHYPGSESAILSILGYAPGSLPSGRGPLEALGCGLHLPVDSAVVARYRLKDPSADFRKDFPGLVFHPLSKASGLVFSRSGSNPGPGNENMDFWSADTPKAYPSFFSVPDKKALMIGAVPLLKGIASATGMDWFSPPGATGDTATDFNAKGIAAIEALASYDFVAVHIEACDSASHSGDFNTKVAAIEAIDEAIVAPLLDYALTDRGKMALVLLPDHPALCSTGEHTPDPVPAAALIPGIIPDSISRFSEYDVSGGFISSLNIITDLWKQAR